MSSAGGQTTSSSSSSISVYEAVRSLDLASLTAATGAMLAPYAPVLVARVSSRPALRPIIDRIAPAANLALHLDDLIANYDDDSLIGSGPISLPDFSRIPLLERIRTVFAEIRRGTPSSILSSPVVRNEISTTLVVAMLRSFSIVPLSALIQTLALQENGTELIEHIVVNCHQLLLPIVNIVIRDLMQGSLAKNMESFLMRIASLSLSNAHLIRQLLVQRQTSLSIVLQITSECLNDDAEFIAAILNQRDPGSLALIASLKTVAPASAATRAPSSTQRLSSGTISPLGRLLLSRFQQMLRTIQENVASGAQLGHNDASNAALIVRVVCQLHALMQIVLSRDLVAVILDLFGDQRLSAAPMLTDCCLCLLFQCSNLFKVATRDRIVLALCSASRTFLFKQITLACLTADRSISPLLSEAMGFPVRPLTGHLEKLSDLFVSDLSESVVDFALSAPGGSLDLIRYSLNTGLLSSKLDRGGRSRLTSVLSTLIMDALPDPNWAQVLQLSAEFCILTLGRDALQQPLLPESLVIRMLVLAVGSDISRPITPGSIAKPASVLLFAYYMVLYNQIAKDCTFKYSEAILDEIPLLGLAHRLQRSKLGHMIPKYLDLLFDQRVELFDVNAELCDLIPIDSSKPKATGENIHFLERMVDLPVTKSVQYATQVLALVPNMLSLSDTAQATLWFCQMWTRWHQHLGSMSFMFATLQNFLAKPVTICELGRHPLRLLDCHERVWIASANLLTIYLSSVRSFSIRYMRLNEAEEIVPIQIQIMLHILEKCFACNIKSIEQVGCQYVDEEVRRYPTLLRSLLFNGFPTEFLPKLAAGMPALSESVSFLPQLLAQEYEVEQIFSLHLLAQLANLHAPGIDEICQQVLDRFTKETVDSIVPHIGVLRKALPAFLMIAKAFPSMVADIVHLLSIVRPSPGFEAEERSLAAEVEQALVVMLNDVVCRPCTV